MFSASSCLPNALTPNYVSNFIFHCGTNNICFSETINKILGFLLLCFKPAHYPCFVLVSCLPLLNGFSFLTDAQTVWCQLNTETFPDPVTLILVFPFCELLYFVDIHLMTLPYAASCIITSYVLAFSLQLVCHLLEAGVKTFSLIGPKHWAWNMVSLSWLDVVFDWGVEEWYFWQLL